MSKKEFFANFLVDAVSNFKILEKEDSEEKLTFFYVVIHQPQNPNFFNMFIKLHQEVFIPLVKEVQLLVSLYMLQKIQKPEN